MENVKMGKITPHSGRHLLKYLFHRAMDSQHGLGWKGPVLLPPTPRSLQHLPTDSPCASAGSAACEPFLPPATRAMLRAGSCAVPGSADVLLGTLAAAARSSPARRHPPVTSCLLHGSH